MSDTASRCQCEDQKQCRHLGQYRCFKCSKVFAPAFGSTSENSPMKAYVKNDRLILEIPADALVIGCKANGIEVTNRAKMLKHFATHLVDDETMGEDKKINQLLDDIANDAVESAAPWCEIAEKSE